MNYTIPPDRKIIHIDMDCFYAAIEIRDNKALSDKPVAVGGARDKRSVLCTCNYIARSYGVRSAMPTVKALELCPDLVILPVNMAKYKEVSRQIQNIFHEFTNLVEPLSLDEAYLDVTNSSHCQGSATLIAQAIRQRIKDTVGLTASAGVAANKFLAKIGSGWNKPDGIFVIKPADSFKFASKLPVNKLFGVGKVTAAKLLSHNINICSDLYPYSLTELVHKFGKLGISLYNQARGIDNRAVEPGRPRKSLSVETTFINDLNSLEELLNIASQLYEQLQQRLNLAKVNYPIKNVFTKIKFNDFKQTTAEIKTTDIDYNYFKELLLVCYQRYGRPVRLLGLGVSFKTEELKTAQAELF